MKALGRLQTERRTPTPVKTMFAGENTCQMHLMVHISQVRVLAGAYQANAFSEGCREGVENIYHRDQPFRQMVIGILRSIGVLDLLLKHKENVVGRVAALKLGSEWVRKKVLLCVLFIFFQIITKSSLEAGRQCGSRVGVIHKDGSEKFSRTRPRRMVSRGVIVGQRSLLVCY